jgi:hypothetical protein
VRRTRALLFGVLLALLPSTPAMAAAPEVRATLDGRPIPVSEIPDHDCDDLDYPLIRCFTGAPDGDASAVVEIGPLRLAGTAGVAYVTVYSGAGFSGSSLVISQDYDTLAVVGWNDRISSFKGRNSETGKFNTDWFGSGSTWNFCCNQQTGNLGSYDNTFSSVYRT